MYKKKNVLLIDLNNLFFRNFFGNAIDVKNPSFELLYFLVFNQIYIFKNKFKSNEVVLAIDDLVSWRKLYYPNYKWSRKVKKNNDIDWDMFFSKFNEFQYEIENKIPFKVLKINHAEADDIIGIISLQNINKYIVVSNDEDFTQLVSPNTKFYKTGKNEFIKDINTNEFLIERIIKGQKKDDIPNIKTPSNFDITKRKPPLGDKMFDKIVKCGYKKWVIGMGLEDEFKRNEILIDLRKIPVVIKSKIIKKYQEYEYPTNPDKMYSFFKKYKFKYFIDNFHYVEQNLMGLY